MNQHACAINKYHAIYDTCFDEAQIQILAQAYNRWMMKKHATDTRIALLNLKLPAHQLLKMMHAQFQSLCHGEDYCLTQQLIEQFMKDELQNIKTSFKPVGPNGSTEWLTNFHINDVLIDEERKLKDFKFLGAIPIDCASVNWCSLYNLSFDDLLKEGKSRIGIVYNLDQHDQSGSHWVALFLNLKAAQIYYADSAGSKPTPHAQSFIDSAKSWMKQKYQREPDYRYNTVRYQYDNSECGVYACNFILRLLSGETFDHIVQHPLKFEQINGCRNVYFMKRTSPHDTQPELCYGK